MHYLETNYLTSSRSAPRQFHRNGHATGLDVCFILRVRPGILNFVLCSRGHHFRIMCLFICCLAVYLSAVRYPQMAAGGYKHRFDNPWHRLEYVLKGRKPRLPMTPTGIFRHKNDLGGLLLSSVFSDVAKWLCPMMTAMIHLATGIWRWITRTPSKYALRRPKQTPFVRV